MSRSEQALNQATLLGELRSPGRLCHDSGQAVVEFVVALVAGIVVFAALVQIILLGSARTEVMLSARKDAATHAFEPSVENSAEPEYIAEWDKGPDESSYSVDDEMTGAAIGDFKDGILDNARPVELRRRIGVNEISSLDAGYHLLWSLERGHATREVQLMPVIRHMVYGSDSIELECDVWLSADGGVY